MKNKYLLIIAVFFLNALHAQVRQVIDFNTNWKFYLGNDSTAINTTYNDTKWRILSLPHDWSIESNFIKDAPATNQGGLLPGGIGWYRKIFTLPASAKNKNVTIEFDGVYKNSEVWINGKYLGKRPYGYANFLYDLTPHLFFDKVNVIAVKVDNSQQPDSRWYSGSGIYRDVKLLIKNRIAFKENGLHIMPSVVDGDGSLNIHAWIQAPEKSKELFSIVYQLFDASGRLVKDESYHTMMMDELQGDNTKYLFTYRFKNPVLWSPNQPYLYTLKAKLLINGVQKDEVHIRIGIREFSFDAQKGFFLNNQSLKIKGVCMHHDLGALGAAFNKAAAKRQLQILKDMGCNAIRFSHNPPASAMLDLCDEMGFLVIDEAFDMWKKKKNKFDYHLYFDEWAEKDLQSMVLRDRNHPSVFMWSIGNEIREQFDSSGTTITKKLVDIVKALDPTRPVTAALTEMRWMCWALITSITIMPHYRSVSLIKNLLPPKRHQHYPQEASISFHLTVLIFGHPIIKCKIHLQGIKILQPLLTIIRLPTGVAHTKKPGWQ
jgi:beta-galactosidase